MLKPFCGDGYGTAEVFCIIPRVDRAPIPITAAHLHQAKSLGAPTAEAYDRASISNLVCCKFRYASRYANHD